MAGCEIASVYAGIAGGHIRGFNSTAVVAVKDKEVKQGAIARVLAAAGAINIPQDREILHVLRKAYVSAQSALLDKDETIEVPSVGGRAPRVLARRILCEIIEPRVEELFQLVHREVQKAGQEDLLASGAVLTGGSTLLHGMPELAEEVLGLPVRRGLPRDVGGLTDVVKSPQHATAVGLLHYAIKQETEGRVCAGDASSLRERVLGWVKELF